MMNRLAKMAVMAIAGSVMMFSSNVIAEEIEAENAAGCVEEVEEDEESEKIEEIIEKELHEIEEAKEDKVPASEEEESFEEENPEEESFEEECFEEETFEEEYFEEETFEESFEEEEEFITIEDYDTPLGLGYTQEEMEEAAREQQEAQEKQEINQENMRVTIYTSRQDSTLPGEQITLSSQIEGFEDVSGMAYQWMADKGAGFEPVSGANGASYTFTADEENMGWNWRLMVYFC